MYINNRHNTESSVLRWKYFSFSELFSLLRIMRVLLLHMYSANTPSRMRSRETLRPFSILAKYTRACSQTARTGGERRRGACKIVGVKCVVDFRAIFARNIADSDHRCSMHRGSLASIDSEDRGRHKALYAHYKGNPTFSRQVAHYFAFRTISRA